MPRTIVPNESYYNEIVATAIAAYKYNARNGYKVRNWENASEDHTAWIKELAYDPRIMLLAHGIGAERALCEMLGLPYSFGMGKYRTNDIPLYNGYLIDNKNSWGRLASMKVNKEAIDLKIKHEQKLPDLFALVTGMLTRRYYGIGFIYFNDFVSKEHLQPGKLDSDGKWHPYYEAKQQELWWFDEECEPTPAYSQMALNLGSL